MMKFTNADTRKRCIIYSLYRGSKDVFGLDVHLTTFNLANTLDSELNNDSGLKTDVLV